MELHEVHENNYANPFQLPIEVFTEIKQLITKEERKKET